MRIGVMVDVSAQGGGVASVDQQIGRVGAAANDGLDSGWFAHVFGADALTIIAVAGRVVPGIELGTAVVPIYTRHPMALAQQALTTQAAIQKFERDRKMPVTGQISPRLMRELAALTGRPLE